MKTNILDVTSEDSSINSIPRITSKKFIPSWTKLCIVPSILFLILLELPLYAEKPYNTTDAEIVEKGELKLNFGGDYSNNNRSIQFVKAPELLARFGVGLAEFDMYFYYAYINDKESYEDYDRGDLYISTKIRLLNERKYFPYLSMKSEVKLPTASDGKNIGTDETDYFLTFMAKKKIGKFELNAETGIEILGDPNENRSQNDGVIYGARATYQAFKDLICAVEFYGDFIKWERNAVFVSGAFIYELGHKYSIYGGFRKGINEDTDDWGGYIGIGYSFDFLNFMKNNVDDLIK
ncbi:transporter [bacterium]|nr:transporter [bacterium]